MEVDGCGGDDESVWDSRWRFWGDLGGGVKWCGKVWVDELMSA